MERTAVRDWVWLLACGLISSVWCVTAARELSATYDEPGYLRLGLERWRSGDFTGLKRAGVMPLPVDVCTLPLFVAERWTGKPIDASAEIETWLPWARSANLVFWWLLLLYAWRIARSLAGPWAGRLAVAVLAVEPNCLALAFHYRDGRSAGWWRRVAVPAVWFAAAVLAKASAVAFAPLCLLTIECAFVLRHRRPGVQQFARSLRHLAAIGIAGFLLASFYCGNCDGPARQNLVAAAQRIPFDTGKATALFLARHVPLYIHAWDAVVFQMRHNMNGHFGVFLFGQWHPDRALWYYFPAALSIKLPLPLLLLPVVLIVLRPRALANRALAAAGVLLLFSLTCRVQIGIRYMLPLVALGVAGLSAAVVQTWESLPNGWARRGLALGAVAAVGGMAIAAGGAWPNGLCYANRLWGGPGRSYLLLSDSNSDWGQGLKELAAWRDRRHLGLFDVAYFGTDPRIHRLGFRPAFLPGLSPGAAGGPRYIAVSTTALYGHPHCETPAATQLRAMTPIGRTSTFLIFDLAPAGAVTVAAPR